MSKKQITFLLFLFFSIIYYFSSFSKISFGDCIGFVLDVEKRDFLTQVTPLSHFLYINTAVFFAKFLHIDSITVMRLMSVLPGAATIALVYVLAKEFVKENWIAITAAIVMGFGFTFWRSSSTVEVYTYNAFWTILFFISSVKALKTRSSLAIILAGIFLSASLWVHIQNIMLIPAYLFLIFRLRKEQQKIIISLISFSIIFALIFFINHLNNIEAKYAFVSKTGPWVENTFKQSFKDLIIDIVKSFLFLLYNFNIFVIAIIIGAIQSIKRKNEIFNFLLIAVIFTFGFATFYAVSDNYVFFITPYIIFSIFIAFYIETSEYKSLIKKIKFIPILTPFIYIISFQIVSITTIGQNFNEAKLYKDGLKYYMLPWLIDNKGCIEFTLDNIESNDDTEALKSSSLQFIELRKKYQSIEEIRKQ